MTEEKVPGPNFTLEGVPPEHIGAALSVWMNAIDKAFSKADQSELLAAHVAALSTTLVALKKLPGFNCDLLTLRDLLERIERLTTGQKRPLMALAPVPESDENKGGRPASSFSDHQMKVRAVLLVQQLLRWGWSEPDACAIVAKELGKIGVRGRRGGRIAARAVEDWCGEIKATDELYRTGTEAFADFAHVVLTQPEAVRFVRNYVAGAKNMRD